MAKGKHPADDIVLLQLKAYWGAHGPSVIGTGTVVVDICEDLHPSPKDLQRLVDVMSSMGLSSGVISKVLHVVASDVLAATADLIRTARCTSHLDLLPQGCNPCESGKCTAGVCQEKEDECPSDVKSEIKRSPLYADPELARWLAETCDFE